jgi:transposase
MAPKSRAGVAAKQHSSASTSFSLQKPETRGYARRLAIRMLKNPVCISYVAEAVGVRPKTIRAWQRRAANGDSLDDKPSTGRPRKLGHKALRKAIKLLNCKETASLRTAAARLAASGEASVSHSTLARRLKAEGLVYRIYRKVPMMTALHRKKRVAWSLKNMKTNFFNICFSDSKMFSAHPSSGRDGHWQPSSCSSPSNPVPRWALTGHFYMGITPFGPTKLYLATGGAQKNKIYRDSHNKLYKGMCGQEYSKEILPGLLADCASLFTARSNSTSWKFQQDGAVQHRTKEAISIATAAAPHGLLEWPACSPDLSIIENIWAYMAAQLKRKPPCTSLAMLREALEEIRATLTQEFLKPYFDSIPGRLLACIKAGGDTIW